MTNKIRENLTRMEGEMEGDEKYLKRLIYFNHLILYLAVVFTRC
jgi:hypothetical protein